VDAVALLTLLSRVLREGQFFLKKRKSVFLPVSKDMSEKKGVCARALFLLSNAVRQSFFQVKMV
jgi:hypothetical protein